MKYVFVVLHYMAAEVTTAAVGSILENFHWKDINVVIVDNFSPDGSGEMIREKYSADHRVHVVLLQRNEGFARGNNAGYRYAVEKLSPDYIVMMNNDVMIHDRNFLEKIHDEYLSSRFAVLGPDIYSPDGGVHQNPSRLIPLTPAQVSAIAGNNRHFIYRQLIWKLKIKFHLVEIHSATCSDNQYDSRHSGCVLHGACLIFSKDFIRARSNAFNPGTFMYMEEDILHFECTRDRLEMHYCPSLSVIHLEDASTKAAHKNNFRRKILQAGWMAKSAGVLADLMKKTPEQIWQKQ